MITFMTKVEWEALERDVVERIRMLAAIDDPAKMEQTVLQEQIIRDLVKPHVKLLKHFVECVKVSE